MNILSSSTPSLDTSANTLTTKESALLQKHERTIKQTQGAFIACGKALAEIRDLRLYRAKFCSFEDYCQNVWKWGKERARLLIEGASVAEELPPEVRPLVENEGQARALSKVPSEARAAVLKAAAAGGKVTADTITKAAQKGGAPWAPDGNNCCHAHALAEALTPKMEAGAKNVRDGSQALTAPPFLRDATGFPIPAALVPLWNRRGEVQEVLNAISSARVTVRRAMQQDDPLFQPANMSGTCSELNHSYSNMQLAMPYAVCCTCQGISSEKCASCKGRGFISKLHYDVSVPEEIKAIRSRSCVI